MAAKLFFHPSRPRPSLFFDHKSTPQEHAGITSYPCGRIGRLHHRVPHISISARGGPADQLPDNGNNTDASPTSAEKSPSLSSSDSGSQSRPAVTIRYRSRRAMQREQKRREAPPPPPPPKSWDEMTLAEKATEMYMGEKGLLFWLNKFAYASIFIIIGGWILFRFVGPALNLYQLDSAPLPPSALFKSANP